jgi:hypothetical protein
MGWIPDPRGEIQENIRSQSLRLESGEKHTIPNNHPVCRARIEKAKANVGGMMYLYTAS